MSCKNDEGENNEILTTKGEKEQKNASHLFPDPVLPTTPALAPASRLKDTPRKAGSRPARYRSHTSLKDRSPRVGQSSAGLLSAAVSLAASGASRE